MSDTTSELEESPTRKRPPPLRITSVGSVSKLPRIELTLYSLDPSSIIGKQLKRVSRSASHPVLTLDFTDDTTFQVRVDGYDPIHRGIPKELEMDAFFNDLVSHSQVDLTVIDCALITLSDKAFQRNSEHSQDWDQKHLGVAFKFAQTSRWHCVWAIMHEYDGPHCVFRSYDDVYLDQLQRSPRKSRFRKTCI